MTARTAPTTAELAALVDGADLLGPIADELATEIERYLAARRRTAHPLVTATTEELILQALTNLGAAPAATSPTAPELPHGMWRVLPDRLLSLHPGRRREGVARLRISVAEHLELTALVLERWGWAQTDTHIRTTGGRRCILGAQRALFALGYGTEDTAVSAGAHIQGILDGRGIRQPFWQWNDQAHVDRAQVLALVRDAAAAARR